MRIRPDATKRLRFRMRTSLLVLTVLLSGCQHAADPGPTTPAPSPASPWEEKLRLQDRWIAALLEQNDVLTQESLIPKSSPPPAPAARPVFGPPTPPAPAVPEPKLDVPIHEANAEGIVDVRPSQPADPAARSDNRRELNLQVHALAGGNTPCALINGRIYDVGDSVDGLRLEHVGTNTLLLRGSGYAIRLSPSAVPFRLRLPQ